MYRLVSSVSAALLLVLATGAFAQSTETETVRVQAQVVSQFILTFDGGNGASVQDFNFGNVDSAGISVGNPPRATLKSVNAALGTATYEALGAFNWSMSSSPAKIVTITSASSKTPITSMLLSQLSMKWNRTQGTGGVLLNTMTPLLPVQPWLTAATVGAGALSHVGTVDLELLVSSANTPEANEWTIVFTALGI